LNEFGSTQIDFSEGYMSAPRGCWPLKFVTALENDQLRLAGAYPKRKTFKISLKMQRVSAYNYGCSRSRPNLTKIFHATCRQA